MPGQLKPDARCPVCVGDLVLVTRVTCPAEGRVTLEFDHGPGTRDCRITGPTEPLDKLHDSLHIVAVAHTVCIGAETIRRLTAEGTIWFADQEVGLVAADDIFRKTIEVK